ncbi:MAG: hypothetical protein ABW162_00795 [Candidatus Sedimenticola sp. PURPLELP]
MKARPTDAQPAGVVGEGAHMRCHDLKQVDFDWHDGASPIKTSLNSLNYETDRGDW